MSRLTCFSLLVGACSGKRNGGRFRRRDERCLREITLRHFPDGFTVLRAEGGWYDPGRGRFIEEEARQVLVCATGRRALRAWCEELGLALRQKQLLVVELGPALPYPITRRRVGKSASTTSPK